MLTAEELRAILDYDPTTGAFTWLVGRADRCGQLAGCIHRTGYIQIRWRGHSYRAHRLAWLYVHGEWPLTALDHINLDKGDNRISNLRCCNDSQNQANAKMWRTNTSGHKGVTWVAKRSQWQAVCAMQWLGYFDSKEHAAAAYEKAAREKFGEFARVA